MTVAEQRDTVARATDPAGRLVRTAPIAAQSVVRDDEGGIGFTGEAIVFDDPTWIGSERFGFYEEIAPEAVTKTLREADVRFVVNHDPNLLLARSSADTLRLAATPTGLQVDADMAPTSYAQDAAILLERGDLKEMSFAFEPLDWEAVEREDGKDHYRITDLRLYDVSVVTFPAYASTSAGLRSVAFDALCRAAGLDAAAERRLLSDLTGSTEPEIDSLPEPAAALLRQIAVPAPADTTQSDTTEAPASNSRPPAETTGSPNPTALDHLAARTNLTEESFR